MIVYKNYATFQVLGKEINLISEDLGYGYNTVAEVNDRIHYLGNEFPSISAAIFAWQEINGRDLTDEELRLVLHENHLLSDAI